MREAILPLPQYAFIVWWLVKHRDNFIFHLYGVFLTVSGKDTKHSVTKLTGSQ